MSSPEVEKFEVSDYDLENEFNINRPKWRQTKEQAIYGSFGGDSDDEIDARPAFGGLVNLICSFCRVVIPILCQIQQSQ